MTSITNYFLKNSLLKLYSGALTNLGSKQVLFNTASYYYYQNSWRSQLVATANKNNLPADPNLLALWQNLNTAATSFLSTTSRTNSPYPTDILNAYMDYFTAYDSWADQSFLPKDDTLHDNAVTAYIKIANQMTLFLAPLGIKVDPNLEGVK